MPDEIIIDDGQIKSDQFSTSINSVILLHKPSSVPGLSKLLDSNGYYGRYKILRKVTRKHGETVISIEIYLPNSRASYTWPFRTLYNLTLGALVKKIRIKKIPAIRMIMNHLSLNKISKETTIDGLPKQLMITNRSRDLDYYQYMVSTLLHANLLVLDKTNNTIVFKLTNKEDIEEVNANLFNPDNYLD